MIDITINKIIIRARIKIPNSMKTLGSINSVPATKRQHYSIIRNEYLSAFELKVLYKAVRQYLALERLSIELAILNYLAL